MRKHFIIFLNFTNFILNFDHDFCVLDIVQSHLIYHMLENLNFACMCFPSCILLVIVMQRLNKLVFVHLNLPVVPYISQCRGTIEKTHSHSLHQPHHFTALAMQCFSMAGGAGVHIKHPPEMNLTLCHE